MTTPLTHRQRAERSADLWLNNDNRDEPLATVIAQETYPEELVKAAQDKVGDCQYCGGTGQLGAAWEQFQRYRADDGSCANCYDLRAALDLYPEEPES